MLVTVFGFVSRLMTGGSDGGAFSKATLWVADEDGSEASRKFVAALRGSPTISIRPAADAEAASAAALRQKLEDGEIHHGLVIERGFGEKLAGGELPALRMLCDPDRAIEEQLISVGMMQAVFTTLGPDFAALLTTRSLELAGIPKEWRERTLALSKSFSTGIERLFAEKEEEQNAPPAAGSSGSGSTAAPAEAAEQDGFSVTTMMSQLLPMEREEHRPPARPKQLTYMLAHTVSGISVMMLMFGLVACASLLLREREEGTLSRLLLAPSDRSAILYGKFLFTVIIGLAQLVVLFTFGSFVFDVDVLRDPATFLLITLAVLVACTAFGMLIAAWAKTTKQAEGLSTLLILVMSAVGGAWFPLQMLADRLAWPVKAAMGCTLTHWAVSAYQGLFWYGKSWTDSSILTSIGVLLGFTVVAAFLARRLFERRYVGA